MGKLIAVWVGTRRAEHTLGHCGPSFTEFSNYLWARLVNLAFLFPIYVIAKFPQTLSRWGSRRSQGYTDWAFWLLLAFQGGHLSFIGTVHMNMIASEEDESLNLNTGNTSWKLVSGHRKSLGLPELKTIAWDWTQEFPGATLCSLLQIRASFLQSSLTRSLPAGRDAHNKPLNLKFSFLGFLHFVHFYVGFLILFARLPAVAVS